MAREAAASQDIDATGLPPIPSMQLQQVDNDTPFPHVAFDKMGKGRLFYDVVVCKATFDLADGVLMPSATQPPPVLADRYWDESNAEASSLRLAGDAVLCKPSTDVLLTGTAQSPDGLPRKEWMAAIGVSRADTPLVRHLMRLRGPRHWSHRWARGWRLGRTLETDAVELRHERAYGGRFIVRHSKDAGHWRVCATNPSGCGHWDRAALDPEQRYAAPQIELPDTTIRRIGLHSHPLACRAPVARFWSDRIRHAGTYDDAWQNQAQASLIPDYPADFDNRFFQCAHPNLITEKYLQGDERVHLVGLVNTGHPDRPLIFDLPGWNIGATLMAANGQARQTPMRLDTVHIDLDARAVSLVWRLTLDQRACIEQAVLWTEPA